jgi:hypothetical protein
VKNNRFVVMWDCNGLEAVEQLPDPAETTFALLKGTKPPEYPNIMHWRLRARYNSQRHYEIYAFNADDDLTEVSIRNAFESAPQGIVDFIRANGQKIYSDRVVTKPVIV